MRKTLRTLAVLSLPLLLAPAGCGDGAEPAMGSDAAVGPKDGPAAVVEDLSVLPAADLSAEPPRDLAGGGNPDAAGPEPTIAVPLGVPVTLIGNVLTEVATIPDPALTDWDRWVAADHTPVVYAFTGVREIDDYLKAIVERYYPADGQLDLAGAKAFQDAFTRGLKFYLEGAPPPARDIDYGSLMLQLSGTFSVRGGKTWLKVTSWKYDGGKYSGTVNYPARMMKPDVPFQPNGGTPPVVLKVSAQHTLTCPYIPPGKFFMGSPFYQVRFQDEFPHEVTLTKGFYMAEIPVTQEIFEAVMGKNPTPSHKGPKKAVEKVVYADIQAFCAKLSMMNNRTVRLPTDAEYEYASRVGTSNPGYMERYVISGSGGGADVKQGPASPWGLYDMLSQGWQITSSLKADNIRVPEVDPPGPKPGDPGVQFYAQGDPMHKTRGGPHYDVVRPNLHGAISEKNAISYESPGVEVFRVVVE